MSACESCGSSINIQTGPIGPQGPTGATGTPGSQGPIGPAGPSGISSILINRTVFVDTVNGDDGTGVAGNLALPFKTINAARVAGVALSPTITNRVSIWVWDGYYNDVNDFIQLTSYMDFYMNNAILENTSVELISDNSQLVIDSNVYGQGQFIVPSGINAVVHLDYGSTAPIEKCKIQAKLISCSGSNKAIHIEGTIGVDVESEVYGGSIGAILTNNYGTAVNTFKGKVYSDSPNGAANQAVTLNSAEQDVLYADVIDENNEALKLTRGDVKNCKLISNNPAVGTVITGGAFKQMSNVTLICAGVNSITGNNTIYIQSPVSSNKIHSGTIIIAGGTFVLNSNFK